MTTILVVEDESGLRRVLRELLDCLGYHSIMAENGADALELLAQGHLPDVIMSDLKMPQMGGLEMVRHLKAHPIWQRIPVIIVSGSGDDAHLATSIGAAGFLLKPFTLSALEDALTNLTAA